MKFFKNLLHFLPICYLISLFSCTQSVNHWDQSKLNEALHYASEIGTFSLVIRTSDEIVATYGDIDSLSRVHSIRKAILMAVISQHMDKIDLQATLSDLKIDDYPLPLTELQKQAKVIHLLKSISGINHPAVSQVGNAQLMRDSLLGNVPNEPGTKWAYNNWDYNALTTIFEQEAGLTVSEAFKIGIADHLSIKRFDSFYRGDSTISRHSKVGFRLSALDMSKFGQLFLNRGYWNGQPLISGSWIEQIIQNKVLSPTPSRERYAQGYLWWVPSSDYADGLPEGSYMTTGTGGQRILVIPEWDTVIAHKTITEIPSRERTPVSGNEFEELVRLVSKARISR